MVIFGRQVSGQRANAIARHAFRINFTYDFNSIRLKIFSSAFVFIKYLVSCPLLLAMPRASTHQRQATATLTAAAVCTNLLPALNKGGVRIGIVSSRQSLQSLDRLSAVLTYRLLLRKLRAYDTIRDAILTCARKPKANIVGLIYRTESTTKNCKTEKLKSKSRYVRSNSKSLGNHVVSSEKEKERLQWEGFAEKGFESGMKERKDDGKLIMPLQSFNLLPRDTVFTLYSQLYNRL